MNLTGTTVAFLAEKQFEDLELLYPLIRMREARARTIVIGLGQPSYTGKHGLAVPVDATIGDVDPDTVDGVVVPGGWSPDWLRRDQRVLHFVSAVFKNGGMVASICHGPWVLISANIVRGRALAGVVAVKDDLVNAGAEFVDSEVVADGNLITARTPRDIPAWSRGMVEYLAEQRAKKSQLAPG